MTKPIDGFANFRRKFLKGTILYKEGDPADEVFFLQSGYVVLRKTMESRQLILAILEKGDFFGDIGVFEGIVRYEQAYVLKDADLVVIPQHEFERMIAKNLEIAVRMVKKYCSRMMTTYSWIVEQLPEDDKGRILNAIVTLMSRFGTLREGKVHIPLPLTVHDIAALAGAPVIMAERIMNDLSTGGMVATVNDYLVVLNKEKFAKFIEYYRWRKSFQTPPK